MILDPTEHNKGDIGETSVVTLQRNIARWIETNASSEEFREYNRAKIAYALTDEWERKMGFGSTHPGDFIFPAELQEQHSLIMAYLYFRQSQETLAQCEFFFDGIHLLECQCHEMIMLEICANIILAVST